MKMFSHRTYRIIRAFIWGIMHVGHPVVRVTGRENIPDGPVIFCCNHSSFSDPIWVIVGANLENLPRTMAKKELLELPVLGWLYRKLGAFPVDRASNDIGAIKTAMKTVRDGDKLVIFPEGTRIRKGKKSEPHSGAILIATRSGVPVLPVYLTKEKKLFRPIHLTFGTPYLPETAGSKATPEELVQLSAELLQKIYSLEETQ